MEIIHSILRLCAGVAAIGRSHKRIGVIDVLPLRVEEPRLVIDQYQEYTCAWHYKSSRVEDVEIERAGHSKTKLGFTRATKTSGERRVL